MKRRSHSLLFGVALTSAVLGSQIIACGSSDSSDGDSVGGTGSGSQTGTGSTTGVGLPGGGNGGAGSGTTAPPASPNSNCGTTTNELKKKPADLLLVLDRSGSMTRAMDSSDDCASGSTACDQRWDTMISSLTTVLGTSPADVNWGLKFFTSPKGATNTNSRCYVSPGVEVPVAAGSAATIQAQITQAGTGNSTPTRVAIQTAVTYLGTVTDDNPKYILLATDGEPNCAPGASSTTASDLDATVSAVAAAAAAGYKVFVIGVGPEAGNLTAMAQAGGTNDFYSANTPAELSNALSSIVGTVAAGCTYPVGATQVANPNGIGVYLDKALVPQSASDGWTIDAANTVITLTGSYCASVTAGTKSQVEIYLPCKPDDPLPPLIQ